MTSPAVIVSREGSVATLTLNRPEVGNAMDVSLVEALLCAVLEVEADEAVRAVVLTGAGRMFCAGGDVAAFASAGTATPALVKRLTASLHMAMARLSRAEKPVIVAVNGPAAGAGFGLAMMGDVVLCGRGARFAAAYEALGMSPDAGLTWLLPRLVGLRQAQRIVLTGARISADEAEKLGLVTQVVEDADLIGEAVAIAKRLAVLSASAFSHTRRLLLESLDAGFESHLEREAQSISHLSGALDGQEGISAFVAKRSPEFNRSRRN